MKKARWGAKSTRVHQTSTTWLPTHLPVDTTPSWAPETAEAEKNTRELGLGLGDGAKWFNISRSSLSDMLQVNGQYCVLHRSCSPWNSGFFWKFWNIYPNIWFGAGCIASRKPDTGARESPSNPLTGMWSLSACPIRFPIVHWEWLFVGVAKSHCAPCKSFQNCQTWRYLLN